MQGNYDETRIEDTMLNRVVYRESFYAGLTNEENDQVTSKWQKESVLLEELFDVLIYRNKMSE